MVWQKNFQKIKQLKVRIKKKKKNSQKKVWFNFFDSDGNGVITKADIEDCISFFKVAANMNDDEANEFETTLKKYNCPEKKVVTLETFKKLMSDNVNLFGFDIMKKNIYTALAENKTLDKKMENEEENVQ